MVYDLFSNVIDAANILNIDKEFKEKISIAKDKLYPLKKGKIWPAARMDNRC